MQHVETGSCGDFADRAGRDFPPIFVDNLQFDAGQRDADAAHPLVARRVMILGRQDTDGAGGLGHAILLAEQRLGHGLKALAQQFQRDRRGAIGDAADTGKIGLLSARPVDQHLQRGRHQEKLVEPLVDAVEHAVGVEFGDHHHRRAIVEGDRTDAGAGDMGAGHDCERAVAGLQIDPGMFRLILDQRPQLEQIVIGQHRAFRIAGGAGGIELQHAFRRVGFGQVAGRSVGDKIGQRRQVGDRPGAEDGIGVGSFCRGLLRCGGKFRFADQQRRARVLEHIGDFGGGETPADRRDHHAGAAGCCKQREIKAAILAKPADAVALAQAGTGEGAGIFGGTAVELGIVDQAVGIVDRDIVGGFRRPMDDGRAHAAS